MRAPPVMSNVIVLKAGQNSVFRELYLWLGTIKIVNTKTQETEPRHNTLDVVCSMSIQFPGGFQFQGNFLIALSFSTFRYSFCYEKNKGKEKKA